MWVFFPEARWPPTRFIEADRHFFKRDKLHLSKCIQMYSTDESRLTFRYIESIVSSVMEFLCERKNSEVVRGKKIADCHLYNC